jgi:ribonuclease BN (tRNA processing enzyme)
MKLTVVGCGDAFGSGGRLQTCYCVEEAGNRFLIDCGATTMMGFERLGLDPNSIGTILVSHLHGDHFAGLVWWLLHAQYVCRRTVPLMVVGPRGIEERFTLAAEALFPGSTKTARRYDLRFAELETGSKHSYGPITVLPYEVSHPSGAPSYALRIGMGAKTIGFSGDTEWVDTLTACAEGVDLFICECFGYEKPIPYHMTWRIIEANLPRLHARRILLTHMNNEMLANLSSIRRSGILVAEDGLVLQV